MRRGPKIEVTFQNARIKDEEKFFIYDLIRSGKAKSRKDIQNQYDMRPATISNTIRELVEDRLVIENGGNSRRPGRPEILLSPNSNRFVGISCYMDDNYLYCALVNLANELLVEHKIRLKKSIDNHGLLSVLTEAVETTRGDAPAGADIVGIGMAVSGRMDRAGKIWIETTKHKRLRNFDLARLEKATGLPSCIKRIMDSMLETEMLLDKSLADQNVLLVHWGMGISAAFSHQGRIISQHTGRFGDIGHINARTNAGIKCSCGKYDCIETKASTWALREPFRRLDPSVDKYEESMERFCREHRVMEIPEMAEAMQEFVGSLQIAYRAFSPDQILIFSPFFADDSIIDILASRFRQAIGQVQIPLRILFQRYSSDSPTRFANCYSNCYFSNCYDFFSSALTGVLVARF